jgi:acyl carrier protein
MKNKILNIMSIVFEIDINQISDNVSPQTIEQWTSLRHLQLIISLENEFNITFNNSDLFTMTNLETIIDKINSCLNEK